MSVHKHSTFTLLKLQRHKYILQKYVIADPAFMRMAFSGCSQTIKCNGTVEAEKRDKVQEKKDLTWQ